MTGGFVGMDPDLVEGVAHQLKGKAGEIDGLIAGLDSLITQLEAHWKGHDAAQFQGWWQQQHRPALRHLHDAIEGLGQSALNNAAEQRQVTGR